jgi:hypothetical protein
MTTDELTVATLDVDEARRLTDDIKGFVTFTWDLVQEAYAGRAWAVLGYSSWDDYCEEEFGASRLRLPREERSEVVASLHEAGLSVRAIAVATGSSKSTVARELSPVPNGTPDLFPIYPESDARWQAAAKEVLEAAKQCLAEADRLADEGDRRGALRILVALIPQMETVQGIAWERSNRAQRELGRIFAASTDSQTRGAQT